MTRFHFLQLLKLPATTALVVLGVVVFMLGTFPTAHARMTATPWDGAPMEGNFQNLVWGGSSTLDVAKVMGHPPDEVLKNNNMYPVIENHIFYEPGGTGNASVFVFENGLLAGLYYKSAQNRYMDLSYFLPNNGDRLMNIRAYDAGYQSYYPNFGFNSFGF